MKKNNDEILYNSISNIDENIIASSLVYKPKSKKIIIWASLAACLCAVSVTYAVIYKNNFNKPVNNSEVLSTTNSSSDFHIYSLPKVLSENSENSKQKVLLSPVKTLLDSNTVFMQLLIPLILNQTVHLTMKEILLIAEISLNKIYLIYRQTVSNFPLQAMLLNIIM